MLSDELRLLIRELWPRASWSNSLRDLWVETLAPISYDDARRALFEAKKKYPYPQPEIAWVVEFLPPAVAIAGTGGAVYFVDFDAPSLKYNGRACRASRVFRDREAAVLFCETVRGRLRA